MAPGRNPPAQRPQWGAGGAQRESALLEKTPDLELVNLYPSLGLEKDPARRTHLARYADWVGTMDGIQVMYVYFFVLLLRISVPYCDFLKFIRYRVNLRELSSGESTPTGHPRKS